MGASETRYWGGRREVLQAVSSGKQVGSAPGSQSGEAGWRCSRQSVQGGSDAPAGLELGSPCGRFHSTW